MAKLRNTDVFKALMRVLEEYRIPKEDFDVLNKRPHPMLTVRYCGVLREMSIPSTPKTRGKAPVAYSAQLRRMLKEMQMASLGNSSSVLTSNKDIKLESTSAALTYNGHVISDKGDMLSLTDMWKAAGADPQKAPAKWRALPSAKAFIEHVEVTIGKSDNDLVRTVNGGKTPGTWAHWQIGMAYAKYLDPNFHMWCNSVVRRHMESGTLEVRPDIEMRLAAIEDKLEGLVGGVNRHINDRSESHFIRGSIT